MGFLVVLAVALLARFPLAAAPIPGAAGTGTVSGRLAIVKGGANSDASNAVVWIEGLRAAPSGAKPVRVEMKSQGKKFVPRVVAVGRASEVEFPNVDPIFHNVFSVSPSNRFDLGLYRSGGSKEKRFGEPGLVRVYCNIHPQMVGFVMVVDSDFSAVTGADGAFRFEGVPAGSWTVHAWHEEGGEAQAPVSVRNRSDSPVAMRLDATPYRPGAHKNKYGKDYPPQTGADDERY
ncbi:MAG: carboxypeptidase regulatory-like domain-containing protein [Acidobacteriota bacterium]